MKPTPTPATAPAIRCALYIRVSTDKQADKYGLDAQRTETRATAEKRNYTIVAELVDTVTGKGDVSRDGFDKLRELVHARAIDIVLSQHHDRFWRNAGEHLLFLRELDKHGVRHDYVSWTPEATKEGRLFETMQAGFAEYERELIRDRTTRGSREKARQGKSPTGRAPYGYRRDATALGGLAVDDAQAAVVKQIVAWAAEGVTVRGIAHRLDAQGVRSPGGAKWARMTVRNIVWSEVYLGTGIYNRSNQTETRGRRGPLRDESEWITYQTTPILARELVERARARLQRNKAFKAAWEGTRVYLLAGVGVCARCGRSLHGDSRNPTKMYRCAGRHLDFDAAVRCTFAIPAVAVEEAVWAQIVAIVRDPARLWSGAIDGNVGARRKDAQAELRVLKGALVKNARKIDAYVELYGDGVLTRQAFDKKHAPAVAEGKRLEQAIKAVEAQACRREVDVERTRALAAYCKTIEKGLDRLDATGRRELVRRFVGEHGRVVVGPDAIDVQGALELDRPEPEPRTPAQVLEFRPGPVSSSPREAGHCVPDSVPLAWSIPLDPRGVDG